VRNKILAFFARAHAVRLLFVNASRPSEFEAAFADLVQQRADAPVVSSAVSLLTDPDQIVALAARHAVPAIYAWRPSMAVGGLMSYATNLSSMDGGLHSSRRSFCTCGAERERKNEGAAKAGVRGGGGPRGPVMP
jgi:hypothetical protein